MYNHYFQLKGAPFSIAPDPRYLFMSERHREALAHLLYGVGSGGGFVLLTGEIGAGKTTVCRSFIEQIPENCRLAYIFNPRLSVEELLLSVCDEFRIELPPAGTPLGLKGYVDAINRYLLDAHAQGLNNLLVIDEAQNLSAEVLEQLRLLTNLETSERKLLQIILIGQPELRTMLARPELEQLAQRVIARYHLGPLSVPETGAYVAHRLAVAGAVGQPFPPALTPAIHALTHGVPRRINLLCDRALLGAYVENSQQVTRPILDKAASEVFAGEPAPRRLRLPLVAGAVLAALAVSAAAWQSRPAREAVPIVAAKPAKPVSATVPPVQAIEADALRELAALWGQPLTAGNPCEVALRQNLRCHEGRGGLYELRLLDRPAVVTLHDGPRTGYAVLSAMDAHGVTLSAGARRERIDLATFVGRFGGEFTTFWRMPRGFREQVSEGDHGPDADWLAARLAQLNRAAAPQAGRALDANSREWLRRFQAAQNLKADGVAGPRTYMRLNQLTGVPEPRLLARTGKLVMSYILEALKKAQAERQLGNAPTIHAPSPSYAPPASNASRKPLLIGLGAGALVVAAGAVVLLRQPPAPPTPVQVASVPAPALVVAPPAPAPVPVPAEPVAQIAPAKPKETPARVKPEPVAPVAEPEPRRVEAAEPVLEVPRAAVLPAAPPSADDSVGPVQSLPEAVQREVPKVAFGGYIYSPNPAERLLLVDKMLRREGEEVAPGLVLERLLPKAAIMNFRGYRYRVAY